MDLKKTEYGWYLAFDGGLMQSIQIDFRLGLGFSDALGSAQLYIESSCRLKSSDGEFVFTPSEPSSLAPILPMFNTKVAGIDINAQGRLTIDFCPGVSVEVDPDQSYEAWELSGSTGFLLICSPGGHVSCFDRGLHYAN